MTKQDHIETTTEDKLIRMVQDLFPGATVELETDFFDDLGGTSLTMTRFLPTLFEQFGVELPAYVLFEHPTVAELAREIDRALDESTRSCSSQEYLDRKNASHEETNGVFGSLYCLNFGPTFDAYLGTTHRVIYSEPLQTGLASECKASSIESLAENHIKAMRSLIPDGPYSLLGFCAKSVVAYEMAQRLVDEGESVALLVMIDPPWLCPSKSEWLRDKCVRSWHRLQRISLRKVTSRLSISHPMSINGSAITEGSDDDRPEWLYVAQMAKLYRPIRPLPVRTSMLFSATYNLPEQRDKQFTTIGRWQRLAKHELDVTILPCRHMELLKAPYVSQVVSALTSVMNRATAAVES